MGKSTEFDSKKLAKACEAALKKRNKPCATKGQLFDVPADGAHGSAGLSLRGGNVFRVLECDADLILIQGLGNTNNRYAVSRQFVMTTSAVPADGVAAGTLSPSREAGQLHFSRMSSAGNVAVTVVPDAGLHGPSTSADTAGHRAGTAHESRFCDGSGDWRCGRPGPRAGGCAGPDAVDVLVGSDCNECLTVSQIQILALNGPLDTAHADDQRPLLIAAACADEPDLVLDLAAVPSVDSTGLGMLVGARQRVGQRGGRLRVINARPEVVRQMTVARVWHLLDGDRRERQPPPSRAVHGVDTGRQSAGHVRRGS